MLRDGDQVRDRWGQRQDRRRAGRQARQLVSDEWRQERRRFARLLVQAVGGLLVVVVCVTAFAWWMGVDRFVLGLLIGVGVASVPLLVQQLKIITGIAPRQMGADAERWTAQELGKLDPKRWKVFHDVPVPWGNVDDVAVGPGRVYAIETKWATAKGRFRDGFAKQAARQAEQLASELSSRGVDRPVVPLVVIWGNGVSDALEHKPHLDEASQARIVAGATATDWLERMSKAADGFAVDWPAARAVGQLVEDTPQEQRQDRGRSGRQA